MEKDVKKEIINYAETAQFQTISKNKNIVILKESLKSIRNILEGITASHIATQIGSNLQKFIDMIF